MSPSGAIRFHDESGLDGHGAWVEAAEGYPVDEMEEMLAFLETVGITPDEEEEPELTETGVRIYLRENAEW